MTQFINIKIITDVNADMNLKDNYQSDLLISVFNSSSFFFTVKSSLSEEEKVVFDFSIIFIKMLSNILNTLCKNYKYSDNLKTAAIYYSKINQSAERRILIYININNRKMQS